MVHKPAIRIGFAILAVGFFATPIAARTLGVTAEQFENRRFADAPKLSQGWNAFQQTTRYLTDRMPLRAQAVRANTSIWTDVFGTDPRYGGQTALADDGALPFAGAIERDSLAERGARDGPGTRSGRRGWLYLDLEVACDDSTSAHEPLRRWGALVQAARERGHRSVMFVAPSKVSIYPEYLPARYANEQCIGRRIERYWDTIERSGPDHELFGLREELLRLKGRLGDELFQRKDYHWTTLAATTLVGATLEAVSDEVRLRPKEIVYRGSESYTGDLSIVGGRSETDKRDEYDIAREPGAARVPGRTLLVCDSFAYLWIRLFKPYFSNVRYVYVQDSPEAIAKEMDRSDLVIFAANEVLMRAQGGPRGSAQKILRAVRAAQPGTPRS